MGIVPSWGSFSYAFGPLVAFALIAAFVVAGAGIDARQIDHGATVRHLHVLGPTTVREVEVRSATIGGSAGARTMPAWTC